mgnify:CR=1 FL=1
MLHQQALALGWGYATLQTGSVQADNGQSLTCGIIGLVNKGQPRRVDDWGVLAAWAWGASRVLDYLGKPNRKMCSLYLSMLDKCGIHLDAFGDSKERLVGI